MSDAQDAPEDPRVRFAAERTLLAWVRTGVALMGFGFVIARFGLFLRELTAHAGSAGPFRPTGVSLALGVVLAVSGVLMTALAGREYAAVIRRIDRREPYRPPRVAPGLILTVLVAGVGVLLILYLLTL